MKGIETLSRLLKTLKVSMFEMCKQSLAPLGSLYFNLKEFFSKIIKKVPSSFPSSPFP